MNFGRIPFQFSATDPCVNNRELRKRFGIPVNSDNMYVDCASPRGLRTRSKDSNSASSSPRLQHRVPIFVEGSDQPVKTLDSSVNNVDANKRPNVRVIPIEIEGARGSSSTRHRTFSGPAGFVKDEINQNGFCQPRESNSPVKHSMHDISPPHKLRSPTDPRICNIPIQIEGRDNGAKSEKRAVVNEKIPKSSSFSKSDKTESNGCQVSKTSASAYDLKEQPKSAEPDVNIPLKKIECVLEELKSYRTAVDNFTGTVKDKQYRFLDEMLTRCMLNLDNIDTMGNEEVRAARKEAVRKVQACIDLLESKAVSNLEMQQGNETDSSVNNQQSKVVDNTCEEKDAEMKDVNGIDSQADVEMIESKEDEMKSNLNEGSQSTFNGSLENDVDMIDNKLDLNSAVELGSGESDVMCNQGQLPDVEMVEREDILEAKFEVKQEAAQTEFPDVEMSEDNRESRDGSSETKETKIAEESNAQISLKEDASCEESVVDNVILHELSGTSKNSVENITETNPDSQKLEPSAKVSVTGTAASVDDNESSAEASNNISIESVNETVGVHLTCQ